MSIIYDICKISGVALLLLGLGLKGYLDPQTAAVFLAIYAAWRGFIRSRGGVGRIVLACVEIGFLVAVCGAVVKNGAGPFELAYIILGAFSAAISFFGRQFVGGNLTLDHVVVFGVALLIMIAVGNHLGQRVAVFRTLYIGAAVGALILFMSANSKPGHGKEDAASLLALFLMVGAIYIMIGRPFRKK